MDLKQRLALVVATMAVVGLLGGTGLPSHADPLEQHRRHGTGGLPAPTSWPVGTAGISALLTRCVR